MFQVFQLSYYDYDREGQAFDNLADAKAEAINESITDEPIGVWSSQNKDPDSRIELLSIVYQGEVFSK